MKTALQRFLPILSALALALLSIYWTAQISGQPAREMTTPFSLGVACVLLLTGVLPAFLRPASTHTLIACFAVIFAAFLALPFELDRAPIFHPGIPSYKLLAPYMILRLGNAAILLPMALHLSARFPRSNRVSDRVIYGGYLFSFALLGIFLLSSAPWMRVPLAVLLFSWFTFVIVTAFWNFFATARDSSPKNAHASQQARVILVSVLLAEIPLWLRPLTLTLGLNIIPYNVVLATQLFIPLGISYAVLRHDLFGIDRALRRALTYGTLSVTLLAFYLGLVTTLTELFTGSASRPLASIASLLIAAAVLEPSRRWIQRWLDRLLYPDRLKFQQAVQEAQVYLSGAIRRDEIVRFLKQTFPALIGAEWGALALFPEPDVPPPGVTSPAWSARLVAGSVSLGGYWLGARRAGPSFDAEERERLSAVVQQAALALAYANAYESLYELNQTLENRVKEQTTHALESQKALAAYQERQRIARNLHDSVTQSIFGLHLMARGLKASAPAALKSDLGELEAQAGSTLREMRLLLDQLRNASGEETIDLAEAVRNQCAALADRRGPEGGPLLTVTLGTPASLSIPSGIADEVLWVLREALQNVIRHSGVRTANVRLGASKQLEITVRDAGRGFDPTALPDGHYGLRGLRERILALGGGFDLQSVPGQGTTLTFSLPLPKKV